MTEKDLPSPHMITQYAARGLNVRMIAAEFNMYEADFEKLLKKHKALKKAYDMGEVKAETHIHQALWDSGDTGILLLKARMKLKLNDPVIESMSGNLLKFVLSKSDAKTQKKLENILGLK